MCKICQHSVGRVRNGAFRKPAGWDGPFMHICACVCDSGDELLCRMLWSVNTQKLHGALWVIIIWYNWVFWRDKPCCWLMGKTKLCACLVYSQAELVCVCINMHCAQSLSLSIRELLHARGGSSGGWGRRNPKHTCKNTRSREKKKKKSLKIV